MIVILTLCLLVVTSTSAQAAFLVATIVGAIGFTGLAATAATVIGTVAVAFGLSYVATKFLGPKKAEDPTAAMPSPTAGGAQLTIRMAADVPQSLLVGRAVTAGSRVHAATFGVGGTTQNSDLIEFTALADHPCTALHAVFVGGQSRALPSTDGDRGHVVDGYANKLAIKFYDGTQTTADAFAVTKLSGAADNPWTSEFVGRGRCYVRQHSVYDQTLVPGQMEWKFVVDGIKLYDPRKDSTVAGGSGAHRYTNLATHEWTQNVAVIAYNILRGIYVLDASAQRQFFYGIENTEANQLPPANWFAAMNACDLAVALAGGGTEPQFTAGGEITVDTEPRSAVQELLKACGGRLSELGGVFEIFIDAPGLPTLSITDGDLLANREDQFRPILPLEQRVNHITATYMSPSDGWIKAVAPPRGNDEWEAEDGRRKSAALDAGMVQSATQVQRLQLQMLNRARRARKHVLSLPPPAIVVRPGQIVLWNSERNGYDDKLFEVDSIRYYANLNCDLTVTEVDPADYDWSPSHELPVADGLIVTSRPAPKVVGAITATAFAYQGDAGTKRPAIRLNWDDPEDGDAIGVAYELRVAADPTNVAANSTTGGDVVAALELIILGGLQPVTEYEVRARFISANGYETAWTLWQLVLTPDTRTAADLPLGLQDYITHQVGTAYGRLRQRMEEIEKSLIGLESKTWTDKKDVRSDLAAREGSLSASITEVATVAASETEAVASQVTTVSATVDDLDATVTTQSTAIATITGKLSASWTLKVDAHGRAAGIVAYADDTESALAFTANSFLIALGSADEPDDAVPAFLVQSVSGVPTLFFNGRLLANAVEAGMIQADAVTSEKITAASITTQKLIADAAVRLDSAAPGAQLYVLNGANYYVLSLGVTAVTGKYVLMSSVEIGTPSNGGNFFSTPALNAWSYDFSVEVLVDGAVVDVIPIPAQTYAVQQSTGKVYCRHYGNYASVVMVTLAAGGHTLQMRVRTDQTGVALGDSLQANYLSPVLVAMEKRDNG